MKNYLLFFLFLLPLLLTAQKVQYKTVFMDPCTGQLAENQFFYLVGKDTVFIEHNTLYFNEEPITFALPDTGKYLLKVGLFNNERFDSADVYIKSYGLTVDTFELYRFFGAFSCVGPCFDYYDCDSLCNGFVIDYYKNGKPRIVGTFNKGNPVDSLLEYYPSGQVYHSWYPKTEGEITTYYLLNGTLEKSWEGYGSCVKYSTYHENGQLESESVNYKIEVSRSSKNTCKELSRSFDENGVLMSEDKGNYFYTYFLDGSWKSKYRIIKKSMFFRKIRYWKHRKFVQPEWKSKLIQRSKDGLYLAKFDFWDASANEEYLRDLSQIRIYKNKKLYQKIDYEYEKVVAESQIFVCYYERKGGKWHLQKKEKDEDLSILKTYLSTLLN